MRKTRMRSDIRDASNFSSVGSCQNLTGSQTGLPARLHHSIRAWRAVQEFVEVRGGGDEHTMSSRLLLGLV
jgi:hypothetical protein